MHILAIVGSLRRRSYNRMTYEAVREMLPAGVTVDEADIADIPPYNDDVRLEEGYPSPVRRLREQIAAADAVLFISPEYNFSIPGVLKNAIDWASRAPDQPLKGKPVGIMGATTGLAGTVRMQLALRQTLVYLEALPAGRPEVLIAFATQKFDDEGRLVDEQTRDAVRAGLEALVAWTRRLADGASPGGPSGDPGARR